MFNILSDSVYLSEGIKPWRSVWFITNTKTVERNWMGFRWRNIDTSEKSNNLVDKKKKKKRGEKEGNGAKSRIFRRYGGRSLDLSSLLNKRGYTSDLWSSKRRYYSKGTKAV